MIEELREEKKVFKRNRTPREKLFIVKESFAGIKNLSDIVADLISSNYCKMESENKGKALNQDGFMSTQTDQDNKAVA